MNHNEIHISFHPKNKETVQLLMRNMKETMGEVNVYDEYHNHYEISILSIYYIEVVDHKTFIYTKNEVYRINKSLSALKKELKNYGFCQINVRTLVNKKHMSSYCVTQDCRRKIYLDNQEILVVNRRYKNEFENCLILKR